MLSVLTNSQNEEACISERNLYCVETAVASYSYVADRRNKRVTADYGYWNCMFTVIWLIVYIVGLPVQMLVAYSFEVVAQTLFIAFLLFIVSSYTSSIVAVVCISIIKRKSFIEILDFISEMNNKI